MGKYAPCSYYSIFADIANGCYALERDKKRFSTLRRMTAKTRCPNVEAINEDFLSLDPIDEWFASMSHMYAFIYLFPQQHEPFFPHMFPQFIRPIMQWVSLTVWTIS